MNIFIYNNFYIFAMYQIGSTSRSKVYIGKNAWIIRPDSYLKNFSAFSTDAVLVYAFPNRAATSYKVITLLAFIVIHLLASWQYGVFKGLKQPKSSGWIFMTSMGWYTEEINVICFTKRYSFHDVENVTTA